MEIRETQTGDIVMQGVSEVSVATLEETMKCLEKVSGDTLEVSREGEW